MGVTKNDDIIAEIALKSTFRYDPTYEDYIHITHLGDDGKSINSPKRIMLEKMTEED